MTTPTDGERDLAALCVRLVRRLREVSPDDKLAATATEYLGQRRYLNPLRIKALEKAAPGVREHCPTCGADEPYTGACGTSKDDTRALCRRSTPGVQGDAK